MLDCLQALGILNSDDLLNAVGVVILENPKLFTQTIENLNEFFEGNFYDEEDEGILDLLVTSEFSGCNWESTIDVWVAPEEQETMRNLLEI